ncbi:hypothetical protein FOMPIDRAFT_133460 [Fomitopsis schrenkii]|uniref:Probable alpha/beta-glucosidase agdC n=1 Tax=Fomitopsis schrenkii TaxID=2126942 RepID=S8E4P8_FOMSC|nr:hypothetical protein FOMPIDRAFT_133460 [Fomitopsis schrenkii]
MPLGVALLAALAAASGALANSNPTDSSGVDACPGYTATNVVTSGPNLTASLVLAGEVCNAYGPDIETLNLQVTYETATRIHVKITDANDTRYEVPESVLPRPAADPSVDPNTAAIQFNYTTSPFSFTIYRNSTGEALFTTASHALIFEPQYLRVKTDLPKNPNLYGLGEHTETFCLPTENLTRTFWNRDAYGVPNGTNLYGDHPIYFEHRLSGTHGVFLLNSNGMDIKVTTDDKGSTLEYDVIGGVLDFYFLAGSETDPTEVARQYAEVVGTPAEVPYWSFGFHQCRYGYTDFVDVANVIVNYSDAHIPLETMWTDIDYMYNRRIFTADPDYFPIRRMRELVDYLHEHDQHYVLMTDPAIAYAPNENYSTFDRGSEADVWLKAENGSYLLGVVWPGATVFPDWFHPDTQDFWTNEFQLFYNPEYGIDIDGVWIDMNEPASFCNAPCADPFQQAIDNDDPPARTTLPPAPNAPIFGNEYRKREYTGPVNVVDPPYTINNAAGSLSNKTANTDAVHANGLVEYDTHNLYGTMMSSATREAMLERRPGLRTLIVTRSTFAGAGTKVQKWLGDNLSDWEHYRNSIAGILNFASVFHVPMVGADICGFGDNTTEVLCARWATLGSFYPFMRNHNSLGFVPQEFYRWPTVAEAARNAINTRHRLIDYFYTAFHQASIDGTPILNPLFYKYPQDNKTFGIDLQFFFGPSILVSPVTEENATSVSIYLPDDIFYDFHTFKPVRGNASFVELEVNLTSIPVHIRGGTILPLRAQSAMTTTELRKQDFEIVVAPGLDGSASGSLYLDDGVSLTQHATTEVSVAYSNGTVSISGQYWYNPGVSVSKIVLLDAAKPKRAALNDQDLTDSVAYDPDTRILEVPVDLPFTQNASLHIA